MHRTSQTITLVAFGVLLLAPGKAYGQVAVLSNPVSGGVEMSEVSEWGGFIQNFFRASMVSPDFYAFRALPRSGSTGVYTGSAMASKGVVSGSIGMEPSSGMNLRGASNAGSVMNVLADVVPGSKVRLKFWANMSLNWVGVDMDNQVGFTFNALSGDDKSDGINRNSALLVLDGGATKSEQYDSIVYPSENSYDFEGKTYYTLGAFTINGHAGINSPDNVELSASYGAEIMNIQAYYIGPALTINDGNKQTWLINKELPKQLSVKVAEGETGAPVNGVPVTFTLIEPSNGAKFTNGQTTMGVNTVNGIAGASLTLGSSPGVYTVKATCPADVCTSGAKEVAFTATALTENEATELKEVFCDGTYFAGQALPYPLRVRAYNKFTKEFRNGLTVNFSKTPAEKGSLSAESAQTEGKGIARTWLTLGPLAADLTREQYTITATCPECLANQTVTCPVEAVAVPDKVNSQTDLELFQEANGVALSVVPNVVAPQETEGLKESVVTVQTAPNTAFTATIYTVPYSGGHQHNLNRPVGRWREQGAAPLNVYAGTTDATGKKTLNYVSGEAGGEERIEVVTADGKRGQKFIFVRVVGMAPLPRGAGYFRSGATNPHPANHYGTVGLISNLTLLAEAFKSSTTLSGGGSLSINDMSLISGGVFDTKENWVGDNANTHLCHRRGTSVDLDRGTYDGQDILRIKNMARKINALLMANSHIDCRVVFEKRNSKGECKVHLECPGNPVTCGSLQTDCEE